MPPIDLELQMKFLKELDDALKDALSRYCDDTAEKRAELKYMKSEVLRAQRILKKRMTETPALDAKAPRRAVALDGYQEAVFS